MTRGNKILIDQKALPKATKARGSKTLGRPTFIEKIIWKDESQALVGPQIVSGKGSTSILQAKESPIAAYAEIHRKTEGSEQSFQSPNH